MGIAAADYSGDGRPDLLVTNSHKQLHGVFRSEPAAGSTPAFSDARSDIAPAFDTSLAGWGASWVDLDNDTNLDLVLANGAIPVTGLGKSAEPVQVFENLTGHDHPGEFAAATDTVGLDAAPLVNGRGLAAADFDNDGNVDLAVNTIGGKLMLLRNTGANGNWLEVKLGRFAPGAARHRRSAGRTSPRAGDPCRQQLSLVRGPPGPLRVGPHGEGGRADRPLSRRARDPADRRRCEPGAGGRALGVWFRLRER